ncbi:MAG: 3'-5' exonuclease [Paramuribaculum sp.]|nr:3'-5' exonuclease [Paramuribaculum sp.]MDE6488699.1 3'-5' exonuclease [Paramuribaculum sp.]
MHNTQKYICLDAEFVEGDELIELSIYGLDRKEIYHQRFKPIRYSEWDSSIHHITPDMVAGAPAFSECLADIQQIIDRADALIGFAIENDIFHLERQGVIQLQQKKILELRDWFWINHGKENGLDLFQGISLEKVTDLLDVSFGIEGMHSASGDTLATLDCFLKLFGIFCRRNSLSTDDVENAIRLFENEFAQEKEAYDRAHAEGYAMLLRIGDNGYTLRVRREEPQPSPRLAAMIRVADRKRASVELQNMMARRPMLGKGVYRLNNKDIERFKAYTNGFDSEEHALFKKLEKLSSRFPVSSLKR